jgi:3-hydroxyisobutyrate dehydrogenase
MKLANTVLQEMTEAMNREGWAKRDSRIFMLLQEERAGINIKVAPEKVQEVLDRG